MPTEGDEHPGTSSSSPHGTPFAALDLKRLGSPALSTNPASTAKLSKLLSTSVNFR